MATAVLIDLSNYDTMLVQSADTRSGTPTGNVYFDKASGKIEFITKQELAQVDLGSGAEDNPLDETLGIRNKVWSDLCFWKSGESGWWRP